MGKLPQWSAHTDCGAEDGLAPAMQERKNEKNEKNGWVHFSPFPPWEIKINDFNHYHIVGLQKGVSNPVVLHTEGEDSIDIWEHELLGEFAIAHRVEGGPDVGVEHPGLKLDVIGNKGDPRCAVPLLDANRVDHAVGDDVVVWGVALTLLVMRMGHLPENTTTVEGPRGNSLRELLVWALSREKSVSHKSQQFFLFVCLFVVQVFVKKKKKEKKKKEGHWLVREKVQRSADGDAGIVSCLQSADKTSFLPKSLRS
jgi:hypothetical protein